MGRGQNLLNLVKSIKQEKELQTVQEEIKEVIKPENLKAGVTAFGIEGNKNIVDTSDANLLYNNYYLHPSYTAYAKGSKIRGSMELCNSTKPFSLGTSCTVVNPENPYFILTEQYASGSFQGRIVKLKNSAVNPEWIEGKSICVRANYNPGLTYWSKPWHVEVNVIEDAGGHFYFKSSSGYMSIIGKNAAGANCDYITYSTFCNNLDEITPESWTKNIIKASNYMSDSLGKSGTIYCYSRNSSIQSTGLTGSTGIPSSADKILFNIKTSGLRYYVENGADLYYPVSKNVIANAIGLTSDKIVEGNTVLNVVGTAKLGIDTSDATAIAEDIITGKTAYINGEKITGTLGRSYGSTSIIYSDNIEVADGLTLRFNYTFDEARAFPKGSYIKLQADIDSLRNALGLTADKIKKGETILGVTGTYTGETSNGVEHNGGTN